MTSHPVPPVARLIELLSTVARDGSSGRLLLSAAAGEGGGSLTFEAGRLKSLHPPRGAGWKQPDHRDRENVCREIAALCAQAGAADAAFHATPPAQQGLPQRGLGAGDLAVALAGCLMDEPWLRRTLLDGPDRRLRSAPRPPACPPAETGAAAAFLMGRIGATSSLRQIVGAAPEATLATLQALHVLNAMGLLRIEDAPDMAASTAHAVPDAGPIAAADRFLGRTGPPVPASSSPAKTAGDAVKPRRQIIERVSGQSTDKTERDELIARCEAIKGQDHYSILEVSRQSTEDEIRHGYYKLARRFHPDKVHKPHLRDMLPRLEDMFSAITSAYNTLTDSPARAEYDRVLVEKEAGHRAPDVREQQASARDLFVRGRKQLEARQVFEALRFFEAAVNADPTRAEYHHHLGACQARNPRWRKRAEESLLTAIKMNPGSVESYRELARMYKRGGLNDRASVMYRKVLEWDPENKEALDAVHSDDRKGGGLFGSLFGKA